MSELELEQLQEKIDAGILLAQQRLKEKVLKEDGELEFEVNFNKGLQLEFNGNSELTEVERRKGIPAQYISPSLAKYISVNYPMIQVVEIDFNKDGSQEVSLRNGVELLFDSKGQFVK